MLNWGDKESAERLSTKLKELLRDRTMTYDQLASCYSIKHGQSVTQCLKDMSRDKKQMLLADFVALMTDDFELTGKNQVRAVKAGGAAPPAAANGKPAQPPTAAAAAPPSSPPAGAEEIDMPAPALMKYADVSRGIQNILKELKEPIALEKLENMFSSRFGTDIADVVGMTTGEYLQRKENIFEYKQSENTVFLQGSILSGPPMADPNSNKDEHFVVREFEQLIEAMGPVVYISTLCGKFIQRNGISVTSIINTRPLDLFKRHPGSFLIIGAGNVTLKKFEQLPEVQKLLGKPSSKAQRIAKAAEESQIPIPDAITEQHVVEEFRRLVLNDGTDSVYISSLCGRFLQRFKKPVTAIIDCKPAEFLRRYPDTFVMTGGGNVGLREVLGPDAVSVPPPPPRVPRVLREDRILGEEALAKIELTDELYAKIYGSLAQGSIYQTLVPRLMTICRQIEQGSFLALEEVVLGGAAGKGLATSGPQADIVLFVRQLPFKNFAQWLPHILETLAPVLEFQLEAQKAEKFKVEKDHLRFQLEAGTEKEVTILIYLSPVFKDRQHFMECIKGTQPGERFYFQPALVKERNEFVGRQSQSTKTVIRFMTWWSAKQKWSSHFTTPTDWLLELVVIHAFQQLREASGIADDDISQAEMIGRIMEIFANFDTTKVVWNEQTALYAPQDIWRPLLSHEPLFMDPLNPFSNVADANCFDGSELVKLSQPPECLNNFKQAAAQFLKFDDDADGDEDYDEGCE